jgi:four helix bundle protein
VQDFTKVHVWQRARRLKKEFIHSLTPRRMRPAPGLRSQILRAVGSIGALIAEGCGRRSSKELARYCDMACGSASEVENHLIDCYDYGIITAAQLRAWVRETQTIRRMAFNLGNRARGGDK